MKKLVRGRSGKLVRELERCNRNLLELKRESARYRVLPDINLLASNLLGVNGRA